MESEEVDAVADELDAIRQRITREAAALSLTFAAISDAARADDRRALSSSFVFFGAEVAELSALIGQFEVLSHHRSKLAGDCAQVTACVPMRIAAADECEAAARRSSPEALQTVREIVTYTNEKLAHERLLWAALVHSQQLHIDALAQVVSRSPTMAQWFACSAEHAKRVLLTNSTISVAWAEGLSRIHDFAKLPPQMRECGLEALVSPPNWTDKRQDAPVKPAYSMTTHLTDMLLLAGLVVVDPLLAGSCSEEEREKFVDGAVVGWAAEIDRWTEAERKEVDEWAKAKVLADVSFGAKAPAYPAQLFRLPIGETHALHVGDRVQRVFGQGGNQHGGAVDGVVVEVQAPFMLVVEIGSARGGAPTRIEQHASRWRLVERAHHAGES